MAVIPLKTTINDSYRSTIKKPITFSLFVTVKNVVCVWVAKTLILQELTREPSFFQPKTGT